MTSKTKFELTPIMSLSMFALFALMIPIFTISNSAETQRNAAAAVESSCGGIKQAPCQRGSECVYEDGSRIAPYENALGMCR